ncbi:hypothetical protein Tco_1477129 [Tanacetum coccineum]
MQNGSFIQDRTEGQGITEVSERSGQRDQKQRVVGMERFLKEKKFRNLMDEIPQPDAPSMEYDVPMLLFTELLNHLNIDHLKQVLGLLHVVVYNVASKLDCNSPTELALTNSKDLPSNEVVGHPQEDSSVGGTKSGTQKEA